MFSKKSILLVSLILAFLFFVFSVISIASSSAQDTPKHVTFSAGLIGSSPYLICGAAAEVLNQAIPEINWGVEPGGATANAMAVQRGVTDIGITMTNALCDAWEGNAPYNTPHRDLTVLMALQPMYTQIFALRKAGINEVEDIIGKRYSPSIPGQSSYEANIKILAAHGFTFDDVRKAGGIVQPYGWTEIVDQMKDGHIDVACWTTTVPNPRISEVALLKDINFISIREEMRDKIVNEVAPELTKMVIPKGSYRGQDYDVPTVGTLLVWVIHKDMDEEIVYRITKALWENWGKMKNALSTLDWVTKETIIYDVKLPVHPGALKYYKEIGARLVD